MSGRKDRFKLLLFLTLSSAPAFESLGWHHCKNHYGSKSKRGTEVAAIFYTLFETAKLSRVDPRACVTQAAKRAITEPGAVTLPSDLI